MKISKQKPILSFNDNFSICLFAELKIELKNCVRRESVSIRECENCVTKGVSTVTSLRGCFRYRIHFSPGFRTALLIRFMVVSTLLVLKK